MRKYLLLCIEYVRWFLMVGTSFITGTLFFSSVWEKLFLSVSPPESSLAFIAICSKILGGLISLVLNEGGYFAWTHKAFSSSGHSRIVARLMVRISLVASIVSTLVCMFVYSPMDIPIWLIGMLDWAILSMNIFLIVVNMVAIHKINFKNIDVIDGEFQVVNPTKPNNNTSTQSPSSLPEGRKRGRPRRNSSTQLAVT